MYLKWECVLKNITELIQDMLQLIRW